MRLLYQTFNQGRYSRPLRTIGSRYGTRRLRAELQAQGYRVGRQRLRTELRRQGLWALQPRAFTPRTTDSTHGLRCAPNRLLDQLAPSRAN